MKSRDEMVADADALLHRLFPICRSITGPGVRETLAVMGRTAPFAIREVASGTECFDWTVPDEWTIRDAYVADASGRRIIEFRASNVHVLSYSEPVDREMSFDELLPHLHTHPDLPAAIPYRTAYYRRAWGFCLSQEQLEGMDRNGRYRAKIDSTLAPGSLTYGDRVLNGSGGCEYVISTYSCHPSLANDNLSGLVLWTLLLRELSSRQLRHTYRFVVAPETIGSVVYLSQHRDAMRDVAGGFVISTVAGPGKLGYKQTYRGDSQIDRAVRQAFRELQTDFVEYPFTILGSDERNFSGPAFRIPVGTICKDKYYEYAYYHTSLDDLRFVSASSLVETLDVYLRAIEILEADRTYTSLVAGEPQLGKRGLYTSIGGAVSPQAGADDVNTILSAAFWADGKTSVLGIAERTGLPVGALAAASEKLASAGLVRAEPDLP